MGAGPPRASSDRRSGKETIGAVIGGKPGQFSQRVGVGVLYSGGGDCDGLRSAGRQREERLDGVRGAFDERFHGAVRPVADKSMQMKSTGLAGDEDSITDVLNAALDENAHRAMRAHEYLPATD